MKRKYQIGDRVRILKRIPGFGKIKRDDIFKIEGINPDGHSELIYVASPFKSSNLGWCTFAECEIEPILKHLFEEDI